VEKSTLHAHETTKHYYYNYCSGQQQQQQQQQQTSMMRKCRRLFPTLPRPRLPRLLLLLLLLLCRLGLFPKQQTFCCCRGIDDDNDDDDDDDRSSASSPPLRLFLLDFYDDFGGIPFDSSPQTCQYNSNLLSFVLQHNASQHRLRFAANYTFYFVYGIRASHVQDAILEINGILRFQRHAALERHQRHYYPFPACITMEQSRNVTLTSSSAGADNKEQRGIIDGQGYQWWGIPLLGYLQTVEHRPRLLRFNLTQDLLIENLIFRDSPYHTLFLDTVNRVEIRHVSIVARRTKAAAEEEAQQLGGGGGGPAHGLMDLTAFNTDGIDVSGHNVWVHDCDIWVQDDCIAVKDHGNHSYLYYNDSLPRRQQQQHYVSSNMTFERINATGLGGFVIGSILGKQKVVVNKATVHSSFCLLLEIARVVHNSLAHTHFFRFLFCT
jgi:Glycosyl hydrolases family 28